MKKELHVSWNSFRAKRMQRTHPFRKYILIIKKGGNRIKSDSKKLWKNINKWLISFVYVCIIIFKREKRDIVYIQRGYERFEEKLSGLGAIIAKVDSEKEERKFKLKVGWLLN